MALYYKVRNLPCPGIYLGHGKKENDIRNTGKGGVPKAVEREVLLFTKPEELIQWLDENDILMGISIEDAELLLGYMEGHDYAIGTDKKGKLIRQDLAEEDGDIEEYSIDDMIDTVCEWNYEMILDAEAKKNTSGSDRNFVEKQDYLDSLRQDQIQLDVLFDKTVYGKEIEELARKLARETIEEIQNGKRHDSVGFKVSEEVRGYSMESKGRLR